VSSGGFCAAVYGGGAHEHPSSVAGKAKSNLIMWSFLPTYLSIAKLAPTLEPYLSYSAYLIMGLGLLASYLSAWGYTRAFATGYSRRWTG